MNVYLLYILGVIGSLITTRLLASSEPSPYSSMNCFQQQYDGYKVALNINYVLIGCLTICVPLNYWICYKNQQNIEKNAGKVFSLTTRFNNNNNLYSSLTISKIALSQALILSIYAFNLAVIVKYGLFEIAFPGVHKVLWFYTIPYAGLALPISITFSINKIQKSRMARIEQLQRTSYSQLTYSKYW
ncbi:unnamed protein product [Caenorhabditis angaria]|uniref:Uncharacterized protein n=1 Tax=Caenorhabditis angaria TaxID=860376 RepID=A0A9P1MUV6_9PELO|nr:unnamed protein product [Caenorhabditis angaria]